MLVLLGLSAIGLVVLVVLSVVLMSRLWLPCLGCWIFFCSTLAGVFLVVTAGLPLFGLGALLEHVLGEAGQDGTQTYLIQGIAFALMFLGKWLLNLRNKRPFPAIMRRLIRWRFKGRVGDTFPLGLPNDHPRRLAFRAVFDDSYGGDPRHGSVEGWGVRACCKRLRAIKAMP